MAVRIIREAYVKDYLDKSTIYRMLRNPGFGNVDSYVCLNGMIIRTNDGKSNRYWKFTRNDKNWEAREVDRNGLDIGNGKVITFDFDEQKLNKRGLIEYINQNGYNKFKIYCASPYTGGALDKNGESVGIKDIGYLSLDDLIYFLNNKDNYYSINNSKVITLVDRDSAKYYLGSKADSVLISMYK